MSEQDRNTKFKGFAKLLYDDLYDTFSNLFIEESNGAPEEEQAEQTRRNIQDIIAERAYDFAQHVTWAAPVTEYEWDVMNVPDLTAWPEQKEQS